MLNKELHEQHMKNILDSIFTHEIGNFLAFKGGTLAYRLHKLERFSTDIDLDITDLAQEEKIIQSIREILLLLGDIKNETMGKALHRWIFRYDENGMNIKVEVNKRIRDNNTYETQIIGETTVNCMSPTSTFTNKLVALGERFANRDLFDVRFFFQNKFPIDTKLIKERTGLTAKAYYKKLIKELPKHYNESSILHSLGELLDDKQKIRVKKHLLKEVISILKKLVK